MARLATTPAILTTLACLAACSAGPDPSEPSDAGSAAGAGAGRGSPEPPATVGTRGSAPTATPSPGAPVPHERRPRAWADPADVRTTTAVHAVRHLAGRVGPRHGTSPAYRRAARWVRLRLSALGWEVRGQRFPTPGGVSWGVRVPAGRSVNLVATRGDVRPGRPWLAVGAHLDTVPRSPGAEDNASGVGVLLAAAEAVSAARTRLPLVLVVFGSEEPRGPGDDDHHYGSRAYVDSLTRAERRTLRGMISLDRVGVGRVLPVSSAGAPDTPRARVLAAARRAGVAADPLTGDRASDHWSFVRSGLPGVRIGSTPYAGYHSPGDVASVVDRAQLERAARTVVAWVGRPPPDRSSRHAP